MLPIGFAKPSSNQPVYVCEVLDIAIKTRPPTHTACFHPNKVRQPQNRSRPAPIHHPAKPMKSPDTSPPHSPLQEAQGAALAAKKSEHLREEAAVALEVARGELKSCQLVVDEASEAARLREQVT